MCMECSYFNIQLTVTHTSLLVPMETVSLKAMCVITMMTVETIVTKRDVVRKEVFIPPLQGCQLSDSKHRL